MRLAVAGAGGRRGGGVRWELNAQCHLAPRPRLNTIPWPNGDGQVPAAQLANRALAPPAQMASATSDAPSVEALVEALQLLDLSADALGHVLFRLPDAEDIARAAPACKAFNAAAKHATKLRADALPFPLQRLQETVATIPRVLRRDEPALRALRWAEAAGRLPVNLQHDGLLVQLWSGDDRVEVARSLERLSTAVLGYDQPVAHKAWD